MPFGSTNAVATFHPEINGILRPLSGNELVFNEKIRIDEDGVLVVVAYIEDILIATKGGIEKQRKQVRKVFDSLLDNDVCRDQPVSFRSNRGVFFESYCGQIASPYVLK